MFFTNTVTGFSSLQEKGFVDALLGQTGAAEGGKGISGFGMNGNLRI